MNETAMKATAHIDTFARDNLPAAELQPDFINLDRLNYPKRLNAAVEFVDRHVREGRGVRTAVMAPGGLRWSYAELKEKIDRIAGVLTGPLGLVPGNRVLLRGANNPMMVAAYLAVVKAGGVVVATMPLLRAAELAPVVEKAEIRLALCDQKLAEEMEKTRVRAPRLERIVYWTGDGEGELDRLMADAPTGFKACPTFADDVCLFGFTSGTTGVPKGTVHYHRDLLAICDTYAAEILRADAEDVFIGSPPLAFTFGLGGLALFPFRIGAATVLLEKATPDLLAPAIAEYGATVCFTAPTAYRAMLSMLDSHDLSSLRKCVSAGEALPKPTWEAWFDRTGIKIMDGIGATEMLHIFIAAREEDIRPGATGKPVPGYEAKVIDENGGDCPPGVAGRLAVRGPTGCRYLADERQKTYVENGWNITGDTYIRDEDGYFWYQARSDDMIISAGYNIAGPEIEACLLEHPSVAECGVVGAPDPERGQVIVAYVVLAPDAAASDDLAKALQAHVKSSLAPYKYPRIIEFVDDLPKTQTAKLQRHALRDRAAARQSAGSTS